MDKQVRLTDVNVNTLTNYLINAAYFSDLELRNNCYLCFSGEILGLFKELQESNRVKSLTSPGEVRIACRAPHILFNHVTALQSARSNLLREVEGRPRYEAQQQREAQITI